jgi:hypothetical protein
MKNFLLFTVMLLVLLLVVYRQRIFLRDPLGKVERNGIRVQGASVFINYSNDVLVNDVDAAQHYLVQHESVPGTPKKLNCLRGMICWTEADMATVLPLGGAGYRPEVAMSNREVSFRDGAGEGVRVVLW